MRQYLPADIVITREGPRLSLQCTIGSTHERDAVFWAIMELTADLPAHRPMLAGDIGVTPPQKPTMIDLLVQAGIMPAKEPS